MEMLRMSQVERRRLVVMSQVSSGKLTLRQEKFLEPFNAKFGVPAAAAGDLHRAAPAELDLDRVLSVQEERVVQNDWTMRRQNAPLQLPRASGVQPGDGVQVCEQLAGRVRVFVGDRELSWRATRSEPRQPRRPSQRRTGPTKSSQGLRPAVTHPWRGLKRTRPSTPPPAAAATGRCSLVATLAREWEIEPAI